MEGVALDELFWKKLGFFPKRFGTCTFYGVNGEVCFKGFSLLWLFLQALLLSQSDPDDPENYRYASGRLELLEGLPMLDRSKVERPDKEWSSGRPGWGLSNRPYKVLPLQEQSVNRNILEC